MMNDRGFTQEKAFFASSSLWGLHPGYMMEAIAHYPGIHDSTAAKGNSECVNSKK
jgi:hypothetical protein